MKCKCIVGEQSGESEPDRSAGPGHLDGHTIQVEGYRVTMEHVHTAGCQAWPVEPPIQRTT